MDLKSYGLFLDEAISSIRDALDNNNLTLFVGSGVSADSDIPMWGELVDKIKFSLNTTETDSLKLAELFYLQFKENLYYKKISEYIPSSSRPNILHYSLVQLNVKNIITTNWDELLEAAIDDLGQFFEVIKSDDDIGYSNGYAKLIKMHGSLDKKNIVFKESDYLNYNLNFPLVENFIKSVFSTDTVLIVGYSLNDQNIKQVISWVNFQSKHIKPIYFLKTGAQFDYLEYEYYKSKNIFIIYWGDKSVLDHNQSDMACSSLQKKGRMTYSFIKKISVDGNDINELGFSQVCKEFYQDFLPLKYYKYILPQTFVDIVRKKFNLYSFNEFYYRDGAIYSSNKILNRYVSKVKGFRAGFEFLNKVLNQIQVYEVKGVDGRPIHIVDNKIDVELDNCLYEFDFLKLEDELNVIAFQNSKFESDLQIKLRKAYLLYQNQQFRESYEEFCELAKESFKYKKYDIWYIAQYNKKQFTIHLKREELSKGQGTYSVSTLPGYYREIAKIDLQEQISRVPLKFRNALKPLADFISFIDKKIISAISMHNLVENDVEIIKTGGISYNSNINNIVQIWSEIEMFVDSYKLTIEYSDEFRKINEHVFKSVLLKAETETPSNIVFFLFSLGVRNFSKYQDLNAFLSKVYKDKLLVLDDDRNRFKVSYENIVNKISRSNGELSFWPTNYFHSYLIFSAYLKLNKEQFDLILEGFNRLLDENIFTIREYEILNIFLVNQFYKNNNVMSNENIEVIIKSYISFFISGKFSFHAVMAAYHTQLFKSIFVILKEIDEDYSFNDSNKVEEFFVAIKTYHLDNKFQIARVFMVGLWTVSNDTVKACIAGFLNSLESELTGVEQLEMQFLLVSNNINNTLLGSLTEKYNELKSQHSNKDSTDYFKVSHILESIEAFFDPSES